MKLLHTADWHLGKPLYREDRAEDYERMVTEIIDHALDTKPDLIVHAGDVFDTYRPGVAMMYLAMDGLREMAEVAPVVVLCGNHDSPQLLRFLDTVSGERIQFITDLSAVYAPLKFEIGGEGIVLAGIPFVHATTSLAELGVEGVGDSYSDRIQRILETADVALRSEILSSRDIGVLAAHLMVSGAQVSGTERPLHTADVYAAERADLALTPAAYTALGHVHVPQQIGETAHYAGSPLQLDFGEAGEDKRALLVELSPGQPAELTELPITAGRRLQRLDCHIDDLEDTAGAFLEAYGEQNLVNATIQTTTPAHELAAQVHEALGGNTVVKVVEECAAMAVQPAAELDGQEVTEPSLTELFDEYLSSVGGTKQAEASRVQREFAKLLEQETQVHAGGVE